MRLTLVVFLFCSLSFGSAHLGTHAAKVASYPARHPAKTGKALARPTASGAKVSAKALKSAAAFLF